MRASCGPLKSAEQERREEKKTAKRQRIFNAKDNTSRTIYAAFRCLVDASAWADASASEKEKPILDALNL